MALASLSSKFYYFSILFSVKLCSPAALHSPVGLRHPPAWPTCEYRNKQLEKQEERALSPHWHVSGAESKRKV